MKKQKDTATAIAVCIAAVCVALAVYVTGAKTSSTKTPEIVSPTEMAQREAKGMGAYFNLDKQEQETVFRLYKVYDEIQASYSEKIRREEQGGAPISPEETRKFANAITVAKHELEAGVKVILTETEYEEWRKKERRIRVIYNTRNTAGSLN